jgi:hypothetical protein
MERSDSYVGKSKYINKKDENVELLVSSDYKFSLNSRTSDDRRNLSLNAAGWVRFFETGVLPIPNSCALSPQVKTLIKKKAKQPAPVDVDDLKAKLEELKRIQLLMVIGMIVDQSSKKTKQKIRLFIKDLLLLPPMEINRSVSVDKSSSRDENKEKGSMKQQQSQHDDDDSDATDSVASLFFNTNIADEMTSRNENDEEDDDADARNLVGSLELISNTDDKPSSRNKKKEKQGMGQHSQHDDSDSDATDLDESLSLISNNADDSSNRIEHTEDEMMKEQQPQHNDFVSESTGSDESLSLISNNAHDSSNRIENTEDEMIRERQPQHNDSVSESTGSDESLSLISNNADDSMKEQQQQPQHNDFVSESTGSDDSLSLISNNAHDSSNRIENTEDEMIRERQPQHNDSVSDNTVDKSFSCKEQFDSSLLHDDLSDLENDPYILSTPQKTSKKPETNGHGKGSSSSKHNSDKEEEGRAMKSAKSVRALILEVVRIPKKTSKKPETNGHGKGSSSSKTIFSNSDMNRIFLEKISSSPVKMREEEVREIEGVKSVRAHMLEVVKRDSAISDHSPYSRNYDQSIKVPFSKRMDLGPWLARADSLKNNHIRNKGLAGIRNDGNICYLISLIQCFNACHRYLHFQLQSGNLIHSCIERIWNVIPDGHHKSVLEISELARFLRKETADEFCNNGFHDPAELYLRTFELWCFSKYAAILIKYEKVCTECMAQTSVENRIELLALPMFASTFHDAVNDFLNDFSQLESCHSCSGFCTLAGDVKITFNQLLILQVQGLKFKIPNTVKILNYEFTPVGVVSRHDNHYTATAKGPNEDWFAFDDHNFLMTSSPFLDGACLIFLVNKAEINSN